MTTPAGHAWSALRRMPRQPAVRAGEELDDPGLRDDIAFPLSSARVVFADLAAVLHDFPALGPLNKGATEGAAEGTAARVDRWLLEHAALVTARQAAQTDVNTPIPVIGSERRVLRPTGYGRAIVVPVPGGLLDIKGVGVAPDRVPSLRLHENGLVQLGEAVQELLLQWIIDAILGHATAGRLCSVPVYALIDPGFDVRTVDGRLVPAGIIVRRAHRRPKYGVELPLPGSPEQLVKFEIEMLLRQYGVSSCNIGTVLELSAKTGEPAIHYGQFAPMPLGRLTPAEQIMVRRLTRYHDDDVPRRFEVVNVQLCREIGVEPSRATIVDFGHFGLKARFDHPVVSPVRGHVLRWGGAIWPDSPHFVQPHPRLAVPPTLWQGAASWNLADAYRSGAVTGRELVERLLGVIDNAARSWP